MKKEDFTAQTPKFVRIRKNCYFCHKTFTI